MVLGHRMRHEINAALNGLESHFYSPKCPHCGCDNAHLNVRSLSPKETDTKQGGYLVEIKFECECNRTALILAEHKGRVVYGFGETDEYLSKSSGRSEILYRR